MTGASLGAGTCGSSGVEGEDGNGGEGWKCKGRMEVEEKDDGMRCQQPPEGRESTNEEEKYIKNQS